MALGKVETQKQDYMRCHKRRRRTGEGEKHIPVTGDFRVLSLHTPRLSLAAEPVDSKLDKSKTTQYKSHNMTNS